MVTFLKKKYSIAIMKFLKYSKLDSAIPLLRTKVWNGRFCSQEQIELHKML